MHIYKIDIAWYTTLTCIQTISLLLSSPRDGQAISGKIAQLLCAGSEVQQFLLALPMHQASTCGQVLAPCPAPNAEVGCSCSEPNPSQHWIVTDEAIEKLGGQPTNRLSVKQWERGKAFQHPAGLKPMPPDPLQLASTTKPSVCFYLPHKNGIFIVHGHI